MTNDKTGHIKRFTLVQRVFHLLLMLSFMVQTTTGLGRMFYETTFGKDLVFIFGGYEEAALIHKWTGIFMLGLFAVHICYALFALLRSGFFSPDSLMPSFKDIRHFFKHTGWIFGIARHPEFDRWGYWEKFDYWAVFWGMVIIGASGVMLAFPLWASGYLPGWTLNLAFWIHRIEAALAIGHVFIIHFFIAHLRRHNFPMDLAMFQGSVPLHKARQEKPLWAQRTSTGGLVSAVHPVLRFIFYLFGFGMVAACLYLLIGAIINFQGVTW